MLLLQLQKQKKDTKKIGYVRKIYNDAHTLLDVNHPQRILKDNPHLYKRLGMLQQEMGNKYDPNESGGLEIEYYSDAKKNYERAILILCNYIKLFDSPNNRKIGDEQIQLPWNISFPNDYETLITDLLLLYANLLSDKRVLGQQRLGNTVKVLVNEYKNCNLVDTKRDRLIDLKVRLWGCLKKELNAVKETTNPYMHGMYY